MRLFLNPSKLDSLKNKRFWARGVLNSFNYFKGLETSLPELGFWISVWPDLAKFRLQVVGQYFTVYFLFGKMLSLLWQIFDIIGIVLWSNDQIFKNNLTIWSHWFWLTQKTGLKKRKWFIFAKSNFREFFLCSLTMTRRCCSFFWLPKINADFKSKIIL